MLSLREFGGLQEKKKERFLLFKAMGSGEDSIIQGSGSKTNKQRFEALEENQDRIFKSLSELTTSIAHLTRSNNDAIERLERQLAENKGKETIGR